MRKLIFLLGFGVLVVIAILVLRTPKRSANPNSVNSVSTTATSSPLAVQNPEAAKAPAFVLPMERALERVTKKPFGIHVSPKNSPVSPERFTGIHTGVDFETFENEQNVEVPVFAICNGPIVRKAQARGYGGMVVQSCFLEAEPVTVVYGHLQLESIIVQGSTGISAGDKIGILGQGFTNETDGERKHLHLGVHKGEKIDTRGYVATKKELDAWLDVTKYLK